MAKTIHIKAKRLEEYAEIKVLIKHNMETGFRYDKGADKIMPPHFIQEVYCQIGGQEQQVALWGPAVSKDPYLRLLYKDAQVGDKVKIRWVDNFGESDSAEAVIG